MMECPFSVSRGKKAKWVPQVKTWTFVVVDAGSEADGLRKRERGVIDAPEPPFSHFNLEPPLASACERMCHS
jgi:hypothetical protein